MKAALLPERGVVKVDGEPARGFLNGLFTADIGQVTPERPCFAALLSPQGKIIADGIVAEAPAADGGGFFIYCPPAPAPKTPVRQAQFLQAARARHGRGSLGGAGRAGAVGWPGGHGLRPGLSRSSPARPRFTGDAAARSCPGR